MKLRRGLIVVLAMAFAVPTALLAQEGAKSYQIHNRLRLEYDDNIREQEENESSSMKIIEEVEFLVNFNLENTFVSVRYKPSFVYWENRDEDETDFHHDMDFIFNHSFTPRLALSIKDTFRIAQLPEAIEGGAVVRQRSDFTYNALVGTLTYQVTPVGRIEGSGRYNLLRYDEGSIADVEDYDMYIGGLTYRHNFVPETALMVDGRFETIEYDVVDRGSDSVQLGLGVEHMFSPNFLGNARAGYMNKVYNDDELSDDSAPFVDINLTAVPSPATRITFGLGYSLLEADIFPYANQERFRIFSGIAYDITARVAINLVASFSDASYDAADAIPSELEELNIDVNELGDGSEEVLQFSARLTYRVNRSNWLEAGWQFSTLSSDIRQDFDRNRVSIGWKTRL